MEKHIVVAIDGPAGSGKSTVAKLIAERLNFVYIDTGAMYRALTLKAMRKKIDLDDAGALAELARSTKIDLVHDTALKVLLDGEDVTGLIRTPELTNNVKHVAGVAGVRSEMVKLQQSIGKRRSSVLEGRDIGTVVFPDAQYKFYLDAHIEERTKRRHKELLESGQDVTLAAMKQDIEKRDTSDIKRKIGALKKAEDAVVVDTTHLSIDEVVEKLLSHIRP